MRKVILFIAMSLDGCIADCNGDIGWLQGQSVTGNDLTSYEDFIQDIDTVIMGASTYRQITTEFFSDEWVYKQFTSYVITHSSMPSNDMIKFTDESPGQLVRRLKKMDGKSIWICGGAKIVKQLIRDDLIDRYHISIIPTILGKGIYLFEQLEKEVKLQLIETKSYNGITDLIYERR